jgi:hypothetical protein
MPRVETERRLRWAGSLVLMGAGNTVVALDELRWKRLLKTALPTDPLRVRDMLPLVLSVLLLESLDMMEEGGRLRVLSNRIDFISGL